MKRRFFGSIIGGATIAMLLSGCLSLPSNNDGVSSAGNPFEGGGEATISLSVTGSSATAMNITYMTVNSGGGGQEQVADAPLPWSYETTVEGNGYGDSNIVSLVAMGSADGGDITCTVTINGTVVSTHTSSGAYSVVTCSGTD